MVSQTFPLDESRSVTLDTNGDGTLKLGPTRPSETWNVTNLSVTVSTNNKIPRSMIYLGTVSPGGFIGGTENGARDSMGPDLMLWTNQFITVVWKGGDTGATATVSVNGTRTAGAWN